MMKQGDVTIECTPEVAARFGHCERFCAGYELPEDVTLADVVGALQRCETLLALIRDARLLTGPLQNSLEAVVLPKARAVLSSLKPDTAEGE